MFSYHLSASLVGMLVNAFIPIFLFAVGGHAVAVVRNAALSRGFVAA